MTIGSGSGSDDYVISYRNQKWRGIAAAINKFCARIVYDGPSTTAASPNLDQICPVIVTNNIAGNFTAGIPWTIDMGILAREEVGVYSPLTIGSGSGSDDYVISYSNQKWRGIAPAINKFGAGIVNNGPSTTPTPLNLDMICPVIVTNNIAGNFTAGIPEAVDMGKFVTTRQGQ